MYDSNLTFYLVTEDSQKVYNLSKIESRSV